MRTTTRIASSIFFVFCGALHAQTTKEEAQLEADIEKAKAESAASRAAAKKAELELQQAEEKAKLELQAKQDVADESRRKALSEAIKATSELKTDAKDVSVSGTAIESKALAHRALKTAAHQIAKDIGRTLCDRIKQSKPDAPPFLVVLADDQVLEALATYEVGLTTLETLTKQYQSTIEAAQKSYNAIKDHLEKDTRAAAAALPLLLQGVAAIGSIAQTFKTQIGLTAADVSMDVLALRAALIENWIRSTTCPDGRLAARLTAFPNLDRRYESSRVGMRFVDLNKTFNDGVDLESDMSIWLLRAKTEQSNDPKDKKPDLRGANAAKSTTTTTKPKPPSDSSTGDRRQTTLLELEKILAKLKAANQRVEQAIQAFVASSEKQPISALGQLLRLERFAAAASQPTTLTLHLKATASGGNTVTTNSFWSGPKIFHSGGSVLAFALMQADGVYVSGGVLDSHSGYVRLKIDEESTLGSSWSAHSNPSSERP